MPSNHVHVGIAGWSIPKGHAGLFPEEGSHLERCAAVHGRRGQFVVLPPSPAFHLCPLGGGDPGGVRVLPEGPKEITHNRRLVDADEPLDRFLDETGALGAKRGPLLVQLPPSLAFDSGTVATFFATLRQRYTGPVACEPRHPNWFTPEAERLFKAHEVARVAADPSVVPRAAEPGGWGGLKYYRLHGSPKLYYSAYPAESLGAQAGKLTEASAAAPVWCIFDNTALGAAVADAHAVLVRLRG